MQVWLTFHSDGENFKLPHSRFSGSFGHPRLTSCEVLVWGHLQFTGRGRIRATWTWSLQSQVNSPPSRWSRITSDVFLFSSCRLSRAAVLVAMQSSRDLATSTMTVLWVWWGGEVLLNQTVSGFLQVAPCHTVHSDTRTQLTRKLFAGHKNSPMSRKSISVMTSSKNFHDILPSLFIICRTRRSRPGCSIGTQNKWAVSLFHWFFLHHFTVCCVLTCLYWGADLWFTISPPKQLTHLRTMITIFECWTKWFKYWLIFKVTHNPYIELLYNSNQDMRQAGDFIFKTLDDSCRWKHISSHYCCGASLVNLFLISCFKLSVLYLHLQADKHLSRHPIPFLVLGYAKSSFLLNQLNQKSAVSQWWLTDSLLLAKLRTCFLCDRNGLSVCWRAFTEEEERSTHQSCKAEVRIVVSYS